MTDLFIQILPPDQSAIRILESARARLDQDDPNLSIWQIMLANAQHHIGPEWSSSAGTCWNCGAPCYAIGDGRPDYCADCTDDRSEFPDDNTEGSHNV